VNVWLIPRICNAQVADDPGSDPAERCATHSPSIAAFKTGKRHRLGVYWTDEESMAGRKTPLSRRRSDHVSELVHGRQLASL
jgi:hypothetical protein